MVGSRITNQLYINSLTLAERLAEKHHEQPTSATSTAVTMAGKTYNVGVVGYG
jgi:hypothetical protein